MRLFVVFIILIQSAFGATLPSEWINENHEKINPGSVKGQLVEARSYLDKIFSIQEKVLLSSEEKKNGRFTLSHYVTDFSVSKSGLFGLSALKSKSAVEVKWKKASANFIDEGFSDVEIIDDSHEGLKLSAAGIEELALSTGKIKTSNELRKSIESYLFQTKLLMDQMNVLNFPGWKLGGLRLDLNISANGKVSLFTKAGVAVRIRINWKKIKQVSNYQPDKSINSSATRFVNKVLYDLNEIFNDEDIPGFKVKVVSIGVGVSKKGSFFGLFGSSSAGFVGHLRFERNKEKDLVRPTETTPELATEDLEFVEAEDDASKSIISYYLSRAKWRIGLKKSIEMAKYFSSASSRFNGRWMITGLKTEFSLTRSGFLGLANTSSKGVLALELERK